MLTNKSLDDSVSASISTCPPPSTSSHQPQRNGPSACSEGWEEEGQLRGGDENKKIENIIKYNILAFKPLFCPPLCTSPLPTMKLFLCHLMLQVTTPAFVVCGLPVASHCLLIQMSLFNLIVILVSFSIPLLLLRFTSFFPPFFQSPHYFTPFCLLSSPSVAMSWLSSSSSIVVSSSLLQPVLYFTVWMLSAVTHQFANTMLCWARLDCMTRRGYAGHDQDQTSSWQHTNLFLCVGRAEVCNLQQTPRTLLMIDGMSEGKNVPPLVTHWVSHAYQNAKQWE